ncbi:hypothetical protein Aperf_G00000032620 [Anoplocephala perfoliata]
MSMPFENQENEPYSGSSASIIQPVLKRRKTLIEGTMSYTSPDKMQEINFPLLVDPGDDITSPTNTDCFDVQTPSKTLNESDQQSFHLSSPISNFGSLGITTPTGRKKNVNSSFKPRVLFRDMSISQNSLPPRSMVIVNNSTASRIRRFNVPPLATNTANSSRQQISVTSPLRLPLSSNSDSIAISTAKMTVWNRMATNPPAAPNTPVQRQCSNPSLIRKLPYRVNSNPELPIRRILQNLTSKKWRLTALGENRYTQSAVQMARLLLDSK